MATNLPKLKNCPFCDSDSGQLSIKNDYYFAWVSCDRCGAQGGNSLKSFDDAVQIWNVRTVEKPKEI